MGEYFAPPHVREELWEIWQYIARDNLAAADRVWTAAEETFQLLAENPGLGHPRHFQAKAFRTLRVRPVLGFDSYLVLYREVIGGVEILHVSHAARNLNALLRRRRS